MLLADSVTMTTLKEILTGLIVSGCLLFWVVNLLKDFVHWFIRKDYD